MSLSTLKYSCISCFRCAFSVVLSMSFLLCNSPLKGLLQKADKEYSETTLSGKKVQLLTTDAVTQVELDEAELDEDSHQGPKQGTLPTDTPFFKTAQKVSLQILLLEKTKAQHYTPLPLYILYHNLKTLSETDECKPT